MLRLVLARGAVALAFAAGIALAQAGCPPDLPVCDPDPADNVCFGDGDCVLAYCATDCCNCPVAYSRRQLDGTWCLTEYGTTPPIADCLQGRTERCAGHAPCVCAYNVEAWCDAGHCNVRAPRP